MNDLLFSGRHVQIQYMRPAQLEAAMRACPIAYVPFGLIEWDAKHHRIKSIEDLERMVQDVKGC